MLASSGLQLLFSPLRATPLRVGRPSGKAGHTSLSPVAAASDGTPCPVFRESKQVATAAHSRARAAAGDKAEVKSVATAKPVSLEKNWTNTLVVVEGLSDRRAVLKAVPAQVC